MYERGDGDAQAPVISTARCEELYRLYATEVLRVSYYYLGNRQQAEDVTQDVFVKLFTLKSPITPGKEKAWLLKVALNCCRDIWRSGWARRVVLGTAALELTESPDSPEESAEKRELLEAIYRLPAQFKECILLYYYEGLSIPEICEALSLPGGTVSTRLARGRKHLKDILEGK
jgi:RNA polymerase sigma-70 factor (ECF subfamily)